MKFDGKAFAREIESRVMRKVRNFARKPRVVSVLVGADPASELYTALKQSAAKRCGIDFLVQRYTLTRQHDYTDLAQEIARIGEREDVTGVMVQMPLLRQGSGGRAIPLSRKETRSVLEAIPLEKDVDGLRWEESHVVPATVRAILSILDKIAEGAQGSELLESSEPLWGRKFVVVGTHGSVGRPLVYYLRERGVEVTEVNSDTKGLSEELSRGEVVVSCVGKEGLVTGEMVREGAVVVDVGISIIQNSEFRIQKQNLNSKLENQNFAKAVGDMTEEVYDKAMIAVGVPGGVGPVTVACLMESCTELVE